MSKEIFRFFTNDQVRDIAEGVITRSQIIDFAFENKDDHMIATLLEIEAATIGGDAINDLIRRVICYMRNETRYIPLFMNKFVQKGNIKWLTIIFAQPNFRLIDHNVINEVDTSSSSTTRDVVNFLLNNGLDLNKVCALSPHVIKYISNFVENSTLSIFINPNKMDSNGWPFWQHMLLDKESSIGFFKCALEDGSQNFTEKLNLHVKDKEGNTYFHRTYSLCTFLFDLGVDFGTKNNAGLTILEYRKKFIYPWEEIEEYLATRTQAEDALLLEHMTVNLTEKEQQLAEF